MRWERFIHGTQCWAYTRDKFSISFVLYWPESDWTSLEFVISFCLILKISILIIWWSDFQATFRKQYVMASRHAYLVLKFYFLFIQSSLVFTPVWQRTTSHSSHTISDQSQGVVWSMNQAAMCDWVSQGSHGYQTLFLMATQFKHPPITDIHPSRKWTPR